MEKVANLQMPGSVSTGAISRSVRSADSGDGFLQMLQQKQEVSEPKEKPKTDEPEKPVKDTASGTKEEPEKAPEETKAPEEDVQQAAMELAAQQAAQSMVVTPEWQEQPIQMEAAAEVVAAIGEIPPEWTAEETDAVMPEMVQTDSIGDEKMSVTTTEPTVQQPVVQEAEAKENRQEMSMGSEESGKEAVYAEPESTKKSQEPLSGVKEEVPRSEGTEPEVAYGAVNQSQVSGTSEVPVSTGRTEEMVLKSTVEELPQELSKAMSSGQTAGSQTLTVELEPVSLGKLTIRVEYEAGRASVSILASNPKTLELLNEKASEIAAILKERTGEETVIYTQQPESQQDSYEGHQGSHGSREEQKQHREEERHETESFAQQLRLGLV